MATKVKKQHLFDGIFFDTKKELDQYKKEQILKLQIKHGIAPDEKKSKPAKYGNKKTVVDGIKFDSKAEAKHYQELKLLEKAGAISELALQVPFVLAGSCVINGRKRPPLKYLADFVYKRGNSTIIADVKGVETEGYRIKRHLMKSVLNLVITEIRKKKWK